MKNVKEDSKICILGDTHFGVRADSKAFNDYYRRFYDTVFFPTLKSKNITEIYQLGDLFDRRKYINFLTLSECRNYFFDKAASCGINVHILLGNHDIFWRESLQINSPELLLKDYQNITLYSKPVTIKVNSMQVDIVPWICKENEEEVYDFIKNTTSSICLGHFEISGFEMYKGMECSDGISSDIFKKYSLVLSGHYHHRSTKGNITYVGTPCEHTWADFEDPRGFHIFDTGTKTLEFIENPYTIFNKVYYDDSKEVVFDAKEFEHKHVKLVVVNKTKFYEFDEYVRKAYEANPLELKIIEDMSEFENENLNDDDVNLEDTITLLSQYVDSLNTESDKQRIKTLMKTLYVEAQNYEDA